MNDIIIKKENLQPALWDGGKTFEYFIYPANSNYSERNFLFRISSATIEKIPADFTRFKDFNRYLVMLDNQLKIVHNGIEKEYSKNEVFKFDSGDRIVSYSSGTDFNLMTAKSVRFASVEVTSDSEGVTADFIFIFAKSDMLIQSGNKEIELMKNDLLLIENPKKEKTGIRCNSNVIIVQVNI